MKRALLVLSPLVVLSTGFQVARGAVTIVAEEVGDNVVMAGFGTINLAGFTTFREVLLLSGVQAEHSPYPPVLTVGGPTTGSIAADAYGGFPLGPANFGEGGFRLADLVQGDRFGPGNNNFTYEIFVPDNYQSGSPLAGSSTYLNRSFQTLGMTPGTYVWAWGAGGDADSLTLRVVPEPFCAPLLCAGVGTVVARRRKCK